MPSQKRVRWAQLRTGVMAIVAMAILGVLIFQFTSRKPIFSRNVTLYTYLRDSAALAAGAPVRLNGILVGSVTRVALSGSSDPNRIVRVDLSVEQRRLPDIPIDSIAGLGAETVLATKYINITKGRSKETVRPGAELPSEDVTEFEDLVKKGFAVLDSLRATISRIDRIVGQVESGKGSIGKFLVDEEFYQRLVDTVDEMQKVAQAVSSGKGTLGRLLYDEALYNQVLASTQRLDNIIQDVQHGQGTAGKLLRDPALYDETRATIADLRRVITDLNAGKGTAGKLLKDEAAYRQIQSVLTKLETTIDRANQGQGTLGQLLVNPQLYESLTGATTEMRAFIKDVRANPKKFLRIKLAIF